MHLPRLSIFIIVALFIFLNFVHGFSNNKVIDSQILTENIRSNRTITVDANGKGDFKSVQAAIDHVPNRNSKWIMIHISKGVYRWLSCFVRSRRTRFFWCCLICLVQGKGKNTSYQALYIHERWRKREDIDRVVSKLSRRLWVSHFQSRSHKFHRIWHHL